jgi:acyl-CoA dehydrogenase
MDLCFSPQEREFRSEVIAFLDEKLTSDLRRQQRLNTSFFSDPDLGLRWHRILFEKGWIAPSWPREYGGAEWTVAQRYIYDIESHRAGAPYLQVQGLRMIGPLIMKFGTDAQKAKYLPKILSGEDYWCQGYSEPNAGSDLSALTTRATPDGDDYIVSGSKIWTTHAHHANRMFALVRTADTPKRQDGISFLLIDMQTPGITVRPIITIDGEHEVNEVFFDDVRVPQAERIGPENGGWECAKYLLEFERGGGFSCGSLRASLERALRLAHAAKARGGAAADPSIFDRLARIRIDLDALEMLELRVMSGLEAGRNPGVASSVMKIRASEIRQSISEAAVDSLGTEALRWYPQRPLKRHAFDTPIDEDAAAAMPIYLSERAHTIFAGATEIQLSIIAKSIFRYGR